MIPDVVPVTFHLPGTRVPTARRVSVLGAFNGWDAQVHRLRKSPEGDWAITIYLSPSRIAYCFDVDGTAWLDPHDDGRVPNCWVSEYSVRNIEPSDEPTAVRHDGVLRERLLPIQGGSQENSFGWLVENISKATILHLQGEVDLSMARMFNEVLDTVAQTDCPIIVNMSGLRYIDSIGIQELTKFQQTCRRRNQQVVLAGASSTITKVIWLLGIDKIIPIVASVDEALTVLRPLPGAS